MGKERQMKIAFASTPLELQRNFNFQRNCIEFFYDTEYRENWVNSLCASILVSQYLSAFWHKTQHDFIYPQILIITKTRGPKNT